MAPMKSTVSQIGLFFCAILLLTPLAGSTPISISDKKEFIEQTHWLQSHPLPAGDKTFQQKVSALRAWGENNRFPSSHIGIFPNLDDERPRTKSNFKHWLEIDQLYQLACIVDHLETGERYAHPRRPGGRIRFVLDYYHNLIKSGLDVKTEDIDFYVTLDQQGELQQHAQKHRSANTWNRFTREIKSIFSRKSFRLFD